MKAKRKWTSEELDDRIKKYLTDNLKVKTEREFYNNGDSSLLRLVVKLGEEVIAKINL